MTIDEDKLYRAIDEIARQVQLLCAILGDVKFFFRKFKVADGDQGNPSLLVGNGADAATVACAVANACSTVEKLNTLTNNAVEMVGWKSNASSSMKRKCGEQAGHGAITACLEDNDWKVRKAALLALREGVASWEP